MTKTAPIPKPIDQWHEDEKGAKLWWKFPVQEPPYCGTPLDEDFPNDVTHYTDIPVPDSPNQSATLYKALQDEIDIPKRPLNENFWFWQGDGNDHPESLCCPVVVPPDTLRSFVHSQKELVKVKADRDELEAKLRIAVAAIPQREQQILSEIAEAARKATPANITRDPTIRRDCIPLITYR